MDKSMEYIAKQIKDYRARNSITQANFANEIGVSRSTLSLIEKGELMPSLEIFLIISKKIGLNLQKVFDEAAKDIVIVDTNILLQRPQFIELLSEDCSRVCIPETVIEELNNIKERKGTPARKKCAALCMNKINELHKGGKAIEIYKVPDFCKCKINDDTIFKVATAIANENKLNNVYLLSNDIYFKLKPNECTNLKVFTALDYQVEFHSDYMNEYNKGAFNKLFELVKASKHTEILEFDTSELNINVCDPDSGMTPLILAVKQMAKAKNDNKKRESARLTLNALLSLSQIDINAKDNSKFGFPPLSHSIQACDKEIALTLLEHGACVDEPSQNSKNPMNTPLMIAAWHGSKDIVELLVENGACLNQQDQGNGFTPLIKAIFNKYSDIAEYLIEKGADTNIQSHEKKRAIDYAYERKLTNIIELIKNKTQ